MLLYDPGEQASAYNTPEEKALVDADMLRVAKAIAESKRERAKDPVAYDAEIQRIQKKIFSESESSSNPISHASEWIEFDTDEFGNAII